MAELVGGPCDGAVIRTAHECRTIVVPVRHAGGWAKVFYERRPDGKYQYRATEAPADDPPDPGNPEG